MVTVFLASLLLTLGFKELITRFGGNLYTNIRGGTPRAVGIAPFVVLLIFFPAPGKYLILIIGLFALLDDIVGRKKIRGSKLEFGQLSRGIGMLLVMVVGYFYLGPVSILIALMIQPLNIADMQPGTACTTVILMGALVLIGILALGYLYYPVLVLLAACLGYAPLDFRGKIMMGEVGNHSFAVALGVSFAFLGGLIGNFTPATTFVVTLVLLLLTTMVIAYLRQHNLKQFLEKNLNINDPRFGDYFMDVLTGGGLGDLIRRTTLKKRSVTIKNPILVSLGFRRLFYNPYSSK
ncbi:cell wall biosynthesis protein [Methanobacterium lacus]|uniref:Cell wall biosynthesis protein n=1 Tax=Methanobacterium lacus (strain AL-21) TaxID=877455 RepID=F0TBT6_METLA|nr:cell wall biosynthesis protein [Methanobacterium lacus]ADZ10278.1 cell wall biosynthesis protein [Methanobacterium lacus]